jgi:hypothetical protein
MIGDWKRSIVRSCKGRGSYFFEKRVFPDDILRLKIEILLANPSIDNTVTAPTLTIAYNENVDDEIFQVRAGISKPLGTIIENIKPYSFTVRLDNPNRSPITALLQLPISKRSSMPFYPEGTTTPQPADPTLLAAINAGNVATTAQTAVIAGLVTAVNAQPNAIANAVNNDNTRTLPPELYVVNTVPILVLAKSNLTRGANISNQGNTKVKLWVGDDPIAPGVAYTSQGYLFHMEGKGSYELPEPFYKSNVWAVGNNQGGEVSTTRSIDI